MGKISTYTGIFRKDTIITAGAATKETITFTIPSVNHQTVHVYTGDTYDTDHTNTFTVEYGTKYKIELVPEDGYTAGTVSVNGSAVTPPVEGTATEDVLISVTESTINKYTFTITQVDNQTIHIYTGSDYSTDHTKTFQADYGTPYKIELVSNDGYQAGTISSTVSTTGTITQNATITATAAIRMYTATITQSDNETIHVYTGTDYSVDHTESFTAPEGTLYKITVEPVTGYDAGDIYIDGTKAE